MRYGLIIPDFNNLPNGCLFKNLEGKIISTEADSPDKAFSMLMKSWGARKEEYIERARWWFKSEDGEDAIKAVINFKYYVEDLSNRSEACVEIDDKKYEPNSK